MKSKMKSALDPNNGGSNGTNTNDSGIHGEDWGDQVLSETEVSEG